MNGPGGSLASPPLPLVGWGRFPRVACRLSQARDAGEVSAGLRDGASVIARGNGRAYGDCALNPEHVLGLGRQALFTGFDPATGLLVAEAGVLLADVVRVFAPRGWFPPVTPGTRFVTLGGMVACDVHGKNHHGVGSVSRHVAWLEMMLADGSIVRCGPEADADPELFWATCGGMGLTGVVLKVALRLIPIASRFIRQTTRLAPNLDAAVDAFEAGMDATYSVAWIDCLAQGESLGRSIVHFGEHAAPEELTPAQRAASAPSRRPKRVPVDFPDFSLNRLSVTAFNALYWARARPGVSRVDLEGYFYPLDGLLEWNRIYGGSGFMQHQSVLPLESSRAGLRLLLDRIARSGSGSFLAVLKRMGEAAPGPLSFPMPGYTLALDFPVNARNLSLLIELDAIVADHGGRLYLAKDSRAGASSMAGYPGLAAFRAVRDRVDPERRFRSVQSERLGL